MVLVAGLAILARIFAGRKGFSHNQRIILSALAVGLLFWQLKSSGNGIAPDALALLGVAIAVLAASIIFLRRRSDQ